MRRQERVVLGADRREHRVVLRDEDVRDRRERTELGIARPGAFGGADDLDDARLRLADDDRVDDPREGDRVGERERAPRDDERMPAVAVPAPRRNARGSQHAHEAGDLELVRHAEGEHGQLFDGAHRLVGDGMLRLPSRVSLALVVEERTLAREPLRLHERAVDALVAQRAHSDVVRRRVAERDRERRLFGDPPSLVGKPPADALPHGHHDKPVK